jgi:plastocyanin
VTHSETTECRRWRRLPLLAAAAAVPAVLAIAPGSALAAGSSVALTRVSPCTTASCLAFLPAGVSVTTGGTVTWVDPSVTLCTLRPTGSPDPAFRGGGLPGYSYTFTVPGSYAYRCAEHPEVRATLTVVRAAAAAPVAPGATKAVSTKVPATAADPFAVVPVVTTHTPGWVPIALSVGGILLAVAISQIGARLDPGAKR